MLQHDYCYRADTKLFYIYAKGFVNFNKEELDNFIEEFPLENKYNNQLTQVCDLYKSKNNIEILFKFFAIFIFASLINQIFINNQNPIIRNKISIKP